MPTNTTTPTPTTTGKDNGATTLTFHGHVTSSVMWPFDSRWPTSYEWSIATMCLFGMLQRYSTSKIMGPRP